MPEIPRPIPTGTPIVRITMIIRKIEKIEYVFYKLHLYYLSTFIFNSLPGLKCGTNFSGTLTFSPVFGFLPGLSVFELRAKARRLKQKHNILHKHHTAR